MAIVTEREKLDVTILPDGQQRDYLALPEEDRVKGRVRPVRLSYKHAGPAGPSHPIRDLTEEERVRFEGEGYAKFEAYPSGSTLGRFWTQAQLDAVGKGCGSVTTMPRACAETYAVTPGFYGGTFCARCGKHFPVGRDGEFVWLDDETRVGT